MTNKPSPVLMAQSPRRTDAAWGHDSGVCAVVNK